ncbi:MAG: ferrous iron transport protein A [Clostridia bacterium]|nr:ferrous iron transport protein A [Clostridia bacterium]
MPDIDVLSRLSPGDVATVTGLATTGDMRRRLQDIGLIEGTTVRCLQRSPLGDPTAFLIRGAVIALRAIDADGVLIINNE